MVRKLMTNRFSRILICLSAYLIFFLDNCVDGGNTHIGRFSRRTTNHELVIPHKVNENGEFKSHTIPHHYDRNYYKNRDLLEMNSEDVVHYVVPMFGEKRHLELTPNHQILSPGMVVETHSGKKISDRKIRRLGNTQCNYAGSIRGDDDSSVALSTCYGLTGLIRTKHGDFVIEPAEGHDEYSGEEHPHLLYQQDEDNPSNIVACDTNDNIDEVLAKRRFRNRSVKPRPTNVSEYNIEVMIAIDRSMLSYHRKSDIENYVLTVFNMAATIYRDSSLGLNINLEIVRIVFLEAEEHKLNLAPHKDRKKTLKHFQEWQQKMNPGDDTHPNHHDLAILLTRGDVCGDDDNCGILGAAIMGGICDPQYQAAICEDTGLRLGFVIAHEIGHTLAIPHDGSEEADCKETLPNGTMTVMDPSPNIRTSQWSSCSGRFLKLFIEQGYGDCLLDLPVDHGFELPGILPGVMYGADFQCKELLTPTATLCDVGVECSNLICYVEGVGCVETHSMAAPGTNCGDKMWCFDGKCIEVGKRPGSIDGGWSAWSEWSQCSRSCGSGIRSQVRYCTNPVPSGGGSYCKGKRKQHEVCNVEPCQFGSPSFRNLQCSEFNEWTYPEDNKPHLWKAYHMENENPCVLFCVNDKGDVASLRPRVEDGTKCVRGKSDICVDGACREIPCDLRLESNAVADWCGVCRGDGSSCDVKYGELSFDLQKTNKGVVQLVKIPKYSTNIKIEEIEPSDSEIQVIDPSSNATLINGTMPGVYNVSGVKAWLGNIRSNQEALTIPGNISSDIIIMVNVQDNTITKYSYSIPNLTPRYTQFEWDYLDFGKCSSACGPGTEEAQPRCKEKVAGFVDDVHCKDITKPPKRVRPCDLAPCTPRWMIGDWQECSPCPSGKHSRIVKCIIPSGKGETVIDLIREYRCLPPKPKEKEKCVCSNTDQKRQEVESILFPECTTTSLPQTSSSCADVEDVLGAERFKVVVDKENLNKMEFVIHDDSTTQEQDENGSTTQPPRLRGKEVLKFIDKLNKHTGHHMFRT